MEWIGSAVINRSVIFKNQIDIMKKETIEFVEFFRFHKTDIQEFTSVED